MKFRYRLDGYDHDWHDVATRRQAFYTDLPPGSYIFRVIASNSDGIWNESAAKLDFTVLRLTTRQTGSALSVRPCFWRWCGRCISFGCQLAKQFNLRLEERVGERTRIARDLHDTLLQSFHGVMLHFQTGINLLSANPAEPRTAEARKALEKAMHQAKHAIVEGREAIQGLRSSVVETNDLALAMRTLGEELAANANSTAFQVHVEGTAPRDLHPIFATMSTV